MLIYYKLLPIFVICKLSLCYEYVLSNVSGKIENDNFVYYSMQYEGTILLELTSLTGDCDLYVSQKTKKPSYEPDLNCMSSITCGVDSIIIPKSFKRPVGIGIFSHPSHNICSYNLLIYKIDDSQDILNYDPYQETLEAEINKSKEPSNFNVKQEEESLLWVFFKSVVMFLIEIIF